MSTARTGRRAPAKRIVALALVVGLSLVAGVAVLWRLAEPVGGTAAQAVNTAALPDQEETRCRPTSCSPT